MKSLLIKYVLINWILWVYNSKKYMLIQYLNYIIYIIYIKLHFTYLHYCIKFIIKKCQYFNF